MNLSQYEQRVIALFRSGNATDEQYREMARAVACLSECKDGTGMIDSAVGVDDEEETAIRPPMYKC
jgi:hypothetical protein